MRRNGFPAHVEAEKAVDASVARREARRAYSRSGDGEVSEKVLWAWLQLAQKDFGPRLHMERIENLVGAGNADVSGCVDGRYFDIENKTAERPVRSGPIIGPNYIRPSQLVWHTLRWAAGGNNFVLIQVGRQKGALRYLVPGGRIREIEGKTEIALCGMSVIDPREDPADFIKRAVSYRSTLDSEVQGND